MDVKRERKQSHALFASFFYPEPLICCLFHSDLLAFLLVRREGPVLTLESWFCGRDAVTVD